MTLIFKTTRSMVPAPRHTVEAMRVFEYEYEYEHRRKATEHEHEYDTPPNSYSF